MSGKIADGQFSGKMLTKLVDIESLPIALDDPGFWASKALMDAKLSADKPLALWVGEQIVTSQIQADPMAGEMTEEEISSMGTQQVEGMIAMFLQQGMITLTGDSDYEMLFTLKNGEAFLNGNAMPLPF